MVKNEYKQDFKEVFSDSNNIILWHESEDIIKKKKKSLFLKFQFILILRLMIMCLSVFHCSHRLYWIKSHTQNFLWKLLSLQTSQH